MPDCVAAAVALRPATRLQPLFPGVRLVDERSQQATYWLLRATQRALGRAGIGAWADGGTLLGAVRHGGVAPFTDLNSHFEN